MSQEIWCGPKNKPGSIKFISGYSYGSFGWYFEVVIEGPRKGQSYGCCGGVYTKRPAKSFDGEDITKLLRYAMLYRELECGFTSPLKYKGNLAKDAERLRKEDEALQDRIEAQERWGGGYCAPTVVMPPESCWRMGGGSG